jgi:hypothetical protein
VLCFAGSAVVVWVNPQSSADKISTVTALAGIVD